jgi:hypothetical protein
VSRNRVFAVVLLIVAFAGLAASKAFPFLDDVPSAAKTAIAVVSAGCGLAGVALWFRKPSETDTPA